MPVGSLNDYEWWTNDYSGEPLQMFSHAHWGMLAALALLIAVLPLLRGCRWPAVRDAFRLTIAFLMIGIEVLLQLWAVNTGDWSVTTMLPLQLCSVSQYLGAVMLLTQSRRLYDYVYFLGLGGAIPALLTPSLRYGFPHFRYWEYAISHVLIVVAPLYMTVTEGCRPRPRSILHVVVGLTLYMAFAGLVDWLVDANYLFLCRKPSGATPFDLLGPWPWYIAGVETLGILTILLLYLPFACRDWWVRRRASVPTIKSAL